MIESTRRRRTGRRPFQGRGFVRAEDLRLEEMVDFADGRIDLRGRRLVIHSIDAFARFRGALLESVGLLRARQVLTGYGYFWGEADAATMRRIYTWDSMRELLTAGSRLHALQGVVRSRIKSLGFDEEAKTVRCELNWYESGEAEEHLKVYGKTDHAVCWMLAGYASGYYSACLGSKVYFAEQRCRAMGDRICSAVGLDEASWGDELAEVVRYFHVDDVAGEIATLTRELKRRDRELAKQRRQLKSLTSEKRAFPEVRSKPFQDLLDVVDRAATFDTTVLILGETGVGKEVLARRLHELSRRSKGPFVPVNCSALPETLLESELFGHVAGAFTGATAGRVGLFEHASGGTLFLDEIGDVPTATQVKLLRVLESREITRLGESTPRPIDVRIVAATNRNLEEAIETGRFRDDLYYRLGVIRLEVPPLRERTEDIPPLARYFVARFSTKLHIRDLKLDSSCIELLLRYPWPGNIRELENAIEHAAVMSEGGIIRPDDLPQIVRSSPALSAPEGAVGGATLSDVERNYILSVLEAHEGSRTKAAAALGISPTTLWRKLKRWDDR